MLILFGQKKQQHLWIQDLVKQIKEEFEDSVELKQGLALKEGMVCYINYLDEGKVGFQIQHCLWKDVIAEVVTGNDANILRRMIELLRLFQKCTSEPTVVKVHLWKYTTSFLMQQSPLLEEGSCEGNVNVLLQKGKELLETKLWSEPSAWVKFYAKKEDGTWKSKVTVNGKELPFMSHWLAQEVKQLHAEDGYCFRKYYTYLQKEAMPSICETEVRKTIRKCMELLETAKSKQSLLEMEQEIEDSKNVIKECFSLLPDLYMKYAYEQILVEDCIHFMEETSVCTIKTSELPRFAYLDDEVQKRLHEPDMNEVRLQNVLKYSGGYQAALKQIKEHPHLKRLKIAGMVMVVDSNYDMWK